MIGNTSTELLVAWALLAAFLVFGLILYERKGIRLGGVLVLPLLLIYALFDLAALAVFGVAATASFVVGHYLHNRTFLYGRRLLYVFLLVGILATVVARMFIETSLGVVVLAVLPGLFAYNLHREGNYLEGASAFFLWFGILLAAAVAALWFFADTQSARAMTADARGALAAWGASAWTSAGAFLSSAWAWITGQGASTAWVGDAGARFMDGLRIGPAEVMLGGAAVAAAGVAWAEAGGAAE